MLLSHLLRWQRNTIAPSVNTLRRSLDGSKHLSSRAIALGAVLVKGAFTMNANDFIEAIKRLPLPSDIKSELSSTEGVDRLKLEWNDLSEAEKEAYFNSLRLLCITGYIDEVGYLPAEFIPQATEACLDAMHGIPSNQKVGDSMAHHTVLYQARAIGSGIGNAINKCNTSDGLSSLKSYSSNTLVSHISSRATASDCFLFNLMIKGEDKDIVSRLLVKYYTSFTQINKIDKREEYTGTVISNSLDVVFDTVFNSEQDRSNTLKQMRLAKDFIDPDNNSANDIQSSNGKAREDYQSTAFLGAGFYRLGQALFKCAFFLLLFLCIALALGDG